MKILCLLSCLFIISCSSEIVVDTLDPSSSGNLNILINDKISGSFKRTYGANLSLSTNGNLKFSKVCVKEYGKNIVNYVYPNLDDPCFSSLIPSDFNLTSVGEKKLVLFYISESNEALLGGESNSIIYSSNGLPVVVNDSISTHINTSVTINPLDNDSDGEGDTLSLTGVTAPSSGGVVDNGDNSITFTPAGGFEGEVFVDYTVTDERGDSSTGRVHFVVLTNFTWQGSVSDDWSDPLNWCGSIIAGVCQNDGAVPSPADRVYINSSCVRCDIQITSNISIEGLLIEDGFTGSLSQNPGVSITVGSSDWVQNSGDFLGGDSRIYINRGKFYLNGGSFQSTTGDFELYDLKGGYATHDYFTIQNENSFNHNGGRVWFHLRSSNHPEHLIAVADNNPFNNVRVYRTGGGTDDVRLSTGTSPGKVIILGDLSLENISILGDWEIHGDLYYGPEYGTYQGSQDATLTFAGGNSQTVELDPGTGFSEGDVVINKTGGSIELNSDWDVSDSGQNLTFLSGTVLNMNGFDFDIDTNLVLTAGSTINAGGGTLSYGTWNSLGTINP